MSRSVDYHSNAAVVVYLHQEYEGDEFVDQLNWDDFTENLKAIVQHKYPSFQECDSWDGREVHEILENSFATVSISEYNGLVSISLAPKEYIEDLYGNRDLYAIAENWINSTKDNFKKLLDKNFDTLNKLGTFSNGEAVFERSDKKIISSKEGELPI